MDALNNQQRGIAKRMSGVIIGAGAIIGGIIGGGSSLNSISKQNKQKTKAFLKQMHYLQMNYNYNQAALDRQERSKYDSALADLFTMSLNSYQNNSQIEAALAETGTEGRSSGKVMQTVSGQTERQKTAYKESYLNDAWNIRGQKEALYISTKTEVEQARDQLSASYIHGSQAFGQFVNGIATGAALGAATAGAASAVGGAIGGTVGGKTGGMLATKVGVDAISSASPMATAATNVVASAGSKAGFMDRVIANWDSYDKYLKFYNQIANYGNMVQQATQRRRGYYY